MYMGGKGCGFSVLYSINAIWIDLRFYKFPYILINRNLIEFLGIDGVLSVFGSDSRTMLVLLNYLNNN